MRCCSMTNPNAVAGAMPRRLCNHCTRYRRMKIHCKKPTLLRPCYPEAVAPPVMLWAVNKFILVRGRILGSAAVRRRLFPIQVGKGLVCTERRRQSSGLEAVRERELHMEIWEPRYRGSQSQCRTCSSDWLVPFLELPRFTATQCHRGDPIRRARRGVNVARPVCFPCCLFTPRVNTY